MSSIQYTCLKRKIQSGRECPGCSGYKKVLFNIVSGLINSSVKTNRDSLSYGHLLAARQEDGKRSAASNYSVYIVSRGSTLLQATRKSKGQ